MCMYMPCMGCPFRVGGWERPTKEVARCCHLIKCIISEADATYSFVADRPTSLQLSGLYFLSVSATAACSCTPSHCAFGARCGVRRTPPARFAGGLPPLKTSRGLIRLVYYQLSSSLRTAMNASCGTSTEPN